MKPKVRTIEKLYHVEFSREGDCARATFVGANSNNSDVKFKVDIPWSYIALILRDLKRTWTPERESRVSLLNEVDEALKGAR